MTRKTKLYELLKKTFLVNQFAKTSFNLNLFTAVQW